MEGRMPSTTEIDTNAQVIDLRPALAERAAGRAAQIRVAAYAERLKGKFYAGEGDGRMAKRCYAKSDGMIDLAIRAENAAARCRLTSTWVLGDPTGGEAA